jgi:hypothetical protein
VTPKAAEADDTAPDEQAEAEARALERKAAAESRVTEKQRVEAALAAADVEVRVAISIAKGIANTREAGVRRRVFLIERDKRLEAIAKKYGLTNKQLADYMAARGIK